MVEQRSSKSHMWVQILLLLLKKIIKGKHFKFNKIKKIRIFSHLFKKNNHWNKKNFLFNINYFKKTNSNNSFFFSLNIYSKKLANPLTFFQYNKKFSFFFNFFYFKNSNNKFFIRKKNSNNGNMLLNSINSISKISFLFFNYFYFYNNLNLNTNLNFLIFFKLIFNIFNNKKTLLKFSKFENTNFFRNNLIKIEYKVQLKIEKIISVPIYFQFNKEKIIKLFRNILPTHNFNNFKIIKIRKFFLHYFYKSKIYYKNLVQKNIKNFLNIFKISKFDNIYNIIFLTKPCTNFNKFDFALNNTFNSFILKKNNFKTLFFLNKYIINKQILKNRKKWTLLKHSPFLKTLQNVNVMSFRSFYKFHKNKFKLESFLNKKNSYYWLHKNNNTQVQNYFNLNKKNYKIFRLFSKIEMLSFFFFKPLFFKSSLIFNFSDFLINNVFNLYKLKTDLLFNKNTFFFYNNLIPCNCFNYIIKKKIIKTFDHGKISNNLATWYHETLIRFLENYSGKKVYLKIFPFLNNNLNFFEKAQCLLWSQKIGYFRKVLGPRLFLNESLQIIYLCFKLKDPTIFSSWIVSTMKKISFWKLKTFLRYIKYVLRYFFWAVFKELNVKGIKFQLKGKISVAGNSRTRTAFHYVGFTSHATFNNKILYTLNLVRTFTGILGFKLWLVF